ncbi:unnamed protein product, partial [Meganyctiphanes norvegica]
MKSKQTRHEAVTQSQIPCTPGQEYSNISGPIYFSHTSLKADSCQSKKSTPKATDTGTQSTFYESLFSGIDDEVEVEDYPYADLDTLEVKIKQEIDAYYRHVFDNRKEICKKNTAKTFDVLAWWKESHHFLPNLALTARSMLCITATSCNCERAFSSASNINTSKRNRLSSKSVHMLTFLHDN